MFFAPDILEVFPAEVTGVVIEAISDQCPGRVKYQASHWPARLHETHVENQLMPGETVKILGRQGLTLLVKPT